jgi:hypothetical protein
MHIVIPFPASKTKSRSASLPDPVHTYVNLSNPYGMIDQHAAEQGRRAWHALHTYNGQDPESFLLNVFVPMIPAGGCNCQQGYKAILETYPPDFSSPNAFFAWGVTLHNLVNAKINAERGENRRIYTIDEAYSEWRQNDGMEV